MQDTNRQESGLATKVRRRRVLTKMGAIGAVGIAGCSGGDNTNEMTTQTSKKDDGQTQTKEDGKQPAEPNLTTEIRLPPADAQFNAYNPKQFADPPSTYIFDNFMYFNLGELKYSGYAISDYSFEARSATLTIRDGLKWHNGDTVTAEDVATKLKLDMYTGGPLKSFVDDVSGAITVENEKTVKVSLSQQVNNDIKLSLIHNKTLDTKADVFKKHVEAFEDASSSDETDQAIADLSSRVIKKPIGTGPFQFDRVEAQTMYLKKFDDHPDAGNINFNEVNFPFYDSDPVVWEAAINGEIDILSPMFTPGSKLNQFDDSWQHFSLIPNHWGMGIVINHNNEHFSKPKVRQAMMHAMDRDAAAKNGGGGAPIKVGVDVPSGLTGQVNGQIKGKWLKGVYDQFNKYPVDHEKGAQLMREAGYEKSNGKWVDSSGAPVKAHLNAPGWGDWVSAAEVCISNLKDFGFDAKITTQDTNTYLGQTYSSGNFDLGLMGWTEGERPYPFFHFDWLYNSSDAKDIWHVPETFEVPPLGEPSGTKETVNPVELNAQLAKASGEEETELIHKLSWITNQVLPALPIQEKIGQSYFSTDNWNAPPADSNKHQTFWPDSWLPRFGDFTAKTK